MRKIRKTNKLGTTSSKLDKTYPNWKNQTTSKGGHTTQVTNTINTYKKVGIFFKSKNPKVSILDASSGKGLGTMALREMGLNVDDVEPYCEIGRFKPTYTDYKKIKKKYDVVFSNQVINVIPDDWRDDLIKKMSICVKNGGLLIINTRPNSDAKELTNAITLDNDFEVLIKRSKNSFSYQKFFDKEELKNYVEKLIGKDFEISFATLRNSGLKGTMGVVCKKKN